MRRHYKEGYHILRGVGSVSFDQACDDLEDQLNAVAKAFDIKALGFQVKMEDIRDSRVVIMMPVLLKAKKETAA